MVVIWQNIGRANHGHLGPGHLGPWVLDTWLILGQNQERLSSFASKRVVSPPLFSKPNNVELLEIYTIPKTQFKKDGDTRFPLAASYNHPNVRGKGKTQTVDYRLQTGDCRRQSADC